jgi:hypothetical protein
MFDDLKRKVDGALKLAVAGAIAVAGGTAAFMCFAVVLFLAVQQSYGTLEAWVALGALFAAVAATGAITLLVVRSRAARAKRRREHEPSAVARLLQEPAVLLTGIQLARVLGVRGVLPLLIVAAVVGGVMANRNGRPDPLHHHGHAEQEAGEG